MADDTTPTEGAKDTAAKAAGEKESTGTVAADASDPGGGDDEILKDARDPDAVRNALRTERDAAKVAKEEAKAAKAESERLAAKVKEFEDRDKSEQEKAEQRAADAEKKQQETEGRLLRLEVAADKKLPAKLAERLTGSTKAELEADADELLKLVRAEDTVSLDGGARKPAKSGTDMNAEIRRMAGRG